ncbi:hypothetical protein [Patulibacter sp. SYSU D01012]|uniref:hypothetical protein n=1 Tax=Patulibacter sp. SYSU D01012 TaxID=2817381 RepID=UPI001B31540F|nr:hypothetical protein [Patulibacter sp. SYSU D01012]
MPTVQPTPHDPATGEPIREQGTRVGVQAARFLLPAVLLLAAAVAAVLGSETLTILFALAAVIAFVADRIVRYGLASNGERTEDRARRETMQREGHWPGEPPVEQTITTDRPDDPRS